MTYSLLWTADRLCQVGKHCWSLTVAVPDKQQNDWMFVKAATFNSSWLSAGPLSLSKHQVSPPLSLESEQGFFLIPFQGCQSHCLPIGLSIGSLPNGYIRSLLWVSWTDAEKRWKHDWTWIFKAYWWSDVQFHWSATAAEVIKLRPLLASAAGSAHGASQQLG